MPCRCLLFYTQRVFNATATNKSVDLPFSAKNFNRNRPGATMKVAGPKNRSEE